MASGNGWTRPPERSITGRSGAASSRARRKAEVTGISRSEVQDDAAVAERARQIGRRRRELRLLDRELERLIEERIAGLLLDLVLEDAAVGPDVREHGGGEVEPLALRDHGGHHVLFEDGVVHRGEVGVALLGAGGGTLHGARRRSGPLRVRGLLRFRGRLPCRAGQRPVHHLLPGRLAPLGSRRRRSPCRGDRGSGACGRGRRRRFLARQQLRVSRPAQRYHVRDDGLGQRGRPIEEARQHQRGGENDEVQQQSERERGDGGHPALRREQAGRSALAQGRLSSRSGSVIMPSDSTPARRATAMISTTWPYGRERSACRYSSLSFWMRALLESFRSSSAGGISVLPRYTRRSRVMVSTSFSSWCSICCAEARGRSTLTPLWISGAVTMKMIKSTSMTSTRGVTLMSVIARRGPPSPAPNAIRRPS